MNPSSSVPSSPVSSSSSLSPELWQQLQQVAEVLAAVRGGRSAPVALEAVPVALRPGVRALVFQVLRVLGRAEALRRKLATRTPPPLPDALLCAALALIWRQADAPYESFTLVDQAVEAAKRNPAIRPQSGFINACLRRFLREQEALVAATDSEPLAAWNHPRWWIERLKRDHPRQWQEILRADNSHAPMTLRVNRLKTTREAVLRRFEASNLRAEPVGDWGIVLGHPLPVDQIPGFAEGEVSVQDAAAQIAAPLLLDGMDLRQPLQVLDACAAPGGKTAHLVEFAGRDAPLSVTALDIDPQRCERIHQTLARLGIEDRVQVLAADAQEPARWWPQHRDRELFDAILLDAPCTASGIVRRQPDVRWLRRESDIAQLAIIQAGLLTRLWPLLRPGGRLLYCTCSVFRDEGEHQIEAFLAHNTDAVLLPSPGHLLPRDAAMTMGVGDNLPGDHDGFFHALLHKRGP
ncbi:16S rRNA (cytosine(967)-C(5))-methyltransferase RsmB [Xylophilus sp. GOD-11R]|uniref:16S rRNA (cytosine(967)-C(5))-methyltransferase RsmB n=1 Tax=Xylophilus sp. GOD-11R TaxID=3089814 RepID=UPI00298CF8C0|nr:16S rRNA (cytosine(967)-C(5))-methyltransferase RsmB [Xylophilus sp. GOD-11R]WPB57294.1 16S rRNA (cytosine(967)-C(5))-methyltransferase RsmB [Xylophilus sp. GOD-11R]